MIIILYYLEIPFLYPLHSPLCFLPTNSPCIISLRLPAPIDYADLVFGPQEMPVTHSESHTYSQLTCVSAAEKAGIPGNINKAVLEVHSDKSSAKLGIV